MLHIHQNPNARTTPGTRAEIARSDNPTGRAVVCWTPAFSVMCSRQGPEG